MAIGTRRCGHGYGILNAASRAAAAHDLCRSCIHVCSTLFLSDHAMYPCRCVFWGSVQLFGDIVLDTGFSSTLTSLQPSLQYLAGSLSVHKHSVLPLLARHNTIRLSFDLEEGEYLYLHRCDASLPLQHFAMAADNARLSAYSHALRCAVDKLKAAGEDVVALDMGCSSATLAMLTERAGAGSVVAVEAHETLCTVSVKGQVLHPSECIEALQASSPASP